MSQHRLHDSASPHALDHMAYADGVDRPQRLLELEAEDPFWKTLGGSVEDPFGDGGETFRQREKALSLGIGRNIYGPVVAIATETPSQRGTRKPLDPQNSAD